ncbi:hypothetical protein ACHHYP_07704 [Achlya hypogyna]|uniref:Uncharacterized protein n=1 Tax=Achlya hypogyna TaxID=1202772 RepID=A0A1V9YQG2_ACHHY|nr:hypothetical protein ACHHYP_07704 [Achlya hypogyna]
MLAAMALPTTAPRRQHHLVHRLQRCFRRLSNVVRFRRRLQYALVLGLLVCLYGLVASTSYRAAIAADATTTIVLVANYRDSDRCAETLASLFMQAARPDLIAVSIVDQITSDETPCYESYCNRVGASRCLQHQLRRNATIDAMLATGPTAARFEAERAVDAARDTFVLSIDAHLLFVHHWDVLLKGEWAATGNAKAVLTTYPKSTDHAETLVGRLLHAIGISAMPIMCRARIETDDADAMVQYGSALQLWLPVAPRTPWLIAQLAGGFNFGLATTALAVRNDPYTPYLFHGEEYSKAARLFTHGFDMYAPRIDIVYHRYEARKVVWERDWDTRYWIQQASRRRVRYLLGLPVSTMSDVDLSEAARFGLGNERSMAQFQRFSGIDPAAPFGVGKEPQFDNCHELTRVPAASDRRPSRLR